VAWESVDKTKDLKAIAKAEPSVTFDTVEEIPADAALKVSKVRVKAGDYGVWTEVSGVVTNTSPEAIDYVTAVVVFLDSSKKPIGFVDGSVDNLRAGQAKGFKSDSGYMPGRFAKEVKGTRAFAYNLMDF
jgi:hypothetical protein